MPNMLLLSEADLRRCVTLDTAMVEAMADAFAKLSGGAGVRMPPVLRLDIPEHNGEIDVKTAYVPGIDSIAMKMSPGFFDNPQLGLPSLNGLMVLLSAHTGLVEALLLDNGYLTDVRTAAAGAVAAQVLAPAGPVAAGVLGCGTQARLQMEALALVRPLSRVLVWGRDAAKAADYAEEMAPKLGVAVQVAASPEAVVRESAVVVTTTPARAPLVRPEWLHPGLHITAMGSDAEDKNELAPEVLAAADLVVCDRISQCALLGELHHARDRGLTVQPVELGTLVQQRDSARPSEEAVTVCDLTGTGVQDTVIATIAHAAAKRQGIIGREFHA